MMLPQSRTALVFALAALGAFGAGTFVGSRWASTAAELDDSKKSQLAAQTLANETHRTLVNERHLIRVLDNLAEQNLQKEKHAQDRINRLNAELRRRDARLFVPVVASSCGTAADGAGTAAGQPGAEARAELVPEAAIALVDIAADGDAAVRQLNDVIDAYNAAVAACRRPLTGGVAGD